MTELSGRTALITGASRGIGFAISRELALAGAEVVLVSRDAERCAAAVARITAEGGAARALTADINGPEWLVELEQAVPQVDVLVNNAASFATYGPLEEVSREEIEGVLETNIASTLHLVRHVLPGMKARSFGRILNIGSVAGTLGAAGQVAYSTAKAALRGLTVTVAVESAKFGVTCNMLELGLIDTERVREAIDAEVLGHFVRNTPVGRMGTPEEVGHLARLLASPRASFVTGALIPVSGGLGLGLYPEQLS